MSADLSLIDFDPATGSIVYPATPGFKLDQEQVYRTTKLFLPVCNNDLRMAVRQAILQQLTAFHGVQSLLKGLKEAR